ncbi:MAG TPA: hypothetical protein DEA82_08790 [Flavobacteriaceae bacterium]|nr:hypothetical protein [Flavobacteriaceae bacterium]HBR54267.1 hypothetical protein [Flavobacteriaceae bacterium]|tara:strand:- start:535 stop:1080 length:546 start_codon:yes stop_codon:yes gene_type:complete
MKFDEWVFTKTAVSSSSVLDYLLGAIISGFIVSIITSLEWGSWLQILTLIFFIATAVSIGVLVSKIRQYRLFVSNDAIRNSEPLSFTVDTYSSFKESKSSGSLVWFSAILFILSFVLYGVNIYHTTNNQKDKEQNLLNHIKAIESKVEENSDAVIRSLDSKNLLLQNKLDSLETSLKKIKD